MASRNLSHNLMFIVNDVNSSIIISAGSSAAGEPQQPSSDPPLRNLIVTDHLELNVERSEHHIHRESLRQRE